MHSTFRRRIIQEESEEQDEGTKVYEGKSLGVRASATRTTTMTDLVDTRRLRRGGNEGISLMIGGSQNYMWTTLLLIAIALLSVSSSADCLPVDLADARDPSSSALEPSKYSPDGRQRAEEFNLAPAGPGANYQRLVHQGQLYLPALFQSERLSSSQSAPGGSLQGSDYPISTQNEEDSIGTEWETVIDPHLYVLNEWSSSRSPRVQQRKKRSAGPSLSIVNPLDVLRQRLLLEIARRKMIKSQNQILANAEILKNIGRRRR